ncbi:MAG: 4-(cytidine 5'-diphospho)-2-C-methyl-D-erythritol kinase [Hyphomicrobiales bacterium]|nr:4-(cytidine 5'-diphospho)-2-C-methyl-D-erythritol kinase [Hyphomicrobiales bacterium]
MTRHARAPAKINLTLHILGRRADGYHELESLTAFAGVCDHLYFEAGAPLSLTVEGPTAPAAGANDDNLVLRAARNLLERIPAARTGAFRLVKYLPVAAGVGGGSSDAAAALRLLCDENGLTYDDARVLAAARATGADVPVCLQPHARMMAGVGEKLGPALDLPPLCAVLVNPRIAVETRAVFAKLGLQAGQARSFGRHPEIGQAMARADLFAALRKGRNDMEDAAGILARQIVDVLAVLSAARGCRLARMSGSGATCFALFENRRAAVAAARSVRRSRPDWWVKATVLR